MRLSELNELKRLYEISKTGKGVTVLIVGEKGVGKSYILDQFLEWSKTQGAVVLKGNSVYYEAIEPLLPFREVIEQSKDYMLPESSRNIVSFFAKPESRENVELSPFSHANIEVSPLAHIMNVLEILSEQSLVIVAIEDLDRADSSSLSLFQDLSSSIFNKKVMLIGTFTVNTDSPYFRTFYSAITKNPELKEIKMKGIKKEDMKEFVESLGYRVPTFMAEKIYSMCNGVPFIAIEILHIYEKKGLFDERKVWSGHYSENNTPAILSIENYYSIKTQKLGESEKKLLNCAAVIGKKFDREILLKISDVPDPKFSEAINKLIDGNFIFVSNNTLEFSYDFLRKKLYNSIFDLRRKMLHHKIAEYLELYNPNIFQLAYHYYYSGDKKKARDYLIKAGIESKNIYAYAEALDYFKKAGSLNEINDPEILLNIADLNKECGYFTDSLVILNKLFKLAPAPMIGKIYYKIGETYLASGSLNLALSYYTKSLKILPKDAVKELICIYRGTGTVYRFRKEFTRAKDYINKSIEKAKSINDDLDLAEGYKELGNIYYYSFQFNLAEENYKKALEYYLKIRNYDGLSKVYNNLANIYSDSLSIKKAIEYYELSLSYADLIKNRSMLTALNYNLSLLYLQTSDIYMFKKYIFEAEKSSESQSELSTRALIYNVLAEFRFNEGLIDEALKYYKKSQEIYETSEIEYDYYIVADSIERLKFVKSGIYDKKRFEEVYLKLEEKDPDASRKDTLISKILVSFYAADFNSSYDLTEKYMKEVIGREVTMDILSGRVLFAQLDIILKKYNEFLKNYEDIETVTEKNGLNLSDVNILKICKEYITKDPNYDSDLEKQVEFFKTHRLKFYLSSLYFYLGLLQLNLENRRDLIDAAKKLFSEINANVYIEIIKKVEPSIAIRHD